MDKINSDCVQGSMVFSKPEGAGCSVPSAARALLCAEGLLNTMDPVGRSH